MTKKIKSVVSSTKTPPKGKIASITPPKLHQNQFMKGCSFKIICKGNRLNKQGLAPLSLQYFIKDKKGEIGLSLFIPHKRWNDMKQQIDTKGEPLLEGYNLLIEQKRSEFNEALVHLALQKIPPSKELIMNILETKTSREDFIVYFEQKYLNRWDKNEISDNTKKNHKAIFTKCKKFKASWPFNEIDTLFMKNFDNWHMADMRKSFKTGKRIQKNGGYNTRQKALTIVKTYLNLAIKDEKIKFEMPTIPVSYMETSRDYLTLDELKELIRLYFEQRFEYDPDIEGALEKFLVSCSTGIRISDVKRISTTHVSNGFLNFIPYKGRKRGKEINIPVNGFVKKILETKEGLIFGNFSEAVVNRHLKTISKVAKIDKIISMNVARHTFATVFLQMGGDIKALQDLLGHGSIRTTQNYLHKDLGHLSRQMEKGISTLFIDDTIELD